MIAVSRKARDAFAPRRRPGSRTARWLEVAALLDDNPWQRRRKLRLAELVNEPWTWPPPGSSYDSLVVGAFWACDLDPPRAAIYTHAINLRVSLAATGGQPPPARARSRVHAGERSSNIYSRT